MGRALVCICVCPVCFKIVDRSKLIKYCALFLVLRKPKGREREPNRTGTDLRRENKQQRNRENHVYSHE